MESWPLGVFTSIDAGLGVRMEVAQELSVPTIHLHTPHKVNRTPKQAEAFLARLKQCSMRVTVVFGGFDGESYADIPTVGRTIGLVPKETRAERVQEMKEIADFAKLIHAEAVGLHLGVVPEDPKDPDYQALRNIMQDLCDHCQRLGLRFHLETGQETPETLLMFLKDVDRNNLFINFDPANIILYGLGDPIAALKQLGRYVRSVHCKDARASSRPGIDWGAEVPFGEGEVGAETFLRTLAQIGYFGPLTIEREIPAEPERQKEEIGRAIRLIDSLKTKILG